MINNKMLLGVLVFPFRGGIWWCIFSAQRPITSFVPKVGQSSQGLSECKGTIFFGDLQVFCPKSFKLFLA